jgi:hypothetical protein
VACIGYWVHSGVEHLWFPDRNIADVESDDDLVEKVDPEWVFKQHGEQLKPGYYYWTKDGHRVAKVLAEGVRRFGDEESENWHPSFGEDPCIGYWLDTGEAHAWSPRGRCVYNRNKEAYLVDRSSLNLTSETGRKDIQWFIKRIKRESQRKPAAPKKYWIPKGFPCHLQIALSIPGRESWKSISEHRWRMENLLLELARDWEYEYGKGAAARVVQEEVSDTFLDATTASTLEELIQILMYSDLVQLNFSVEGIYDEDLQGACQESTFRDRLADLVRLA